MKFNVRRIVGGYLIDNGQDPVWRAVEGCMILLEAMVEEFGC